MKTSVSIGILIFVIAFSYTFTAMHFVPETKVALFKENIARLASQQASVVEASREEQKTEEVPKTVSEVIEVKPESVYVPAKMTWSLATSTAEWRARDSAASFVFNDKMWIMGGLNGNGVRTNTENAVHYWEATHFNDVWSSEDGIIWSKETAHAEWSQRRSMSVVNFNGKLWMYGGWSPISGYTSDIWSSDDGVHWERSIALAPWTPREGQTVEVFNGKIWLIGGVNYDERTVKNDVWYSEDGTTWYEATQSAPWSGRWDHATAVFNDRIFLVGGMDLSKQAFNDVWATADGIKWELVTDVPPWQTRQGHGLAVFKDALWIIGRLDDEEGGGTNDVWYTLDGLSWGKTEKDPEWLGREDHAVLTFKDYIYVFAGMDSKWKWMNDVWRLE